MASYRLQSVLLNKNRFTLAQAMEYLHMHGLKSIKADLGTNWMHFRQESPDMLKKKGYTKFRVLQIIPNEIEYIVATLP